MSENCYHCGEPIPTGVHLNAIIDSIEQPMCCIGCQTVANTIVENGLIHYYRLRTELAPKGEQLIPEELKKKQLLDEACLQDEFAYQTENYRETILTIEGISCAACAWLIEMQINKLSGLVAITVNATTQRATVRWQEQVLKLSDILIAIEKVGYKALPFKASAVEEANKTQSKTFIKRLGISGILMMQVMMIAVGLYFGAFTYMSESIELYLRWTSLLLTAPIIFYGAFPFYAGAVNALKAKRLSMDVPVSIAILLAFFASTWATLWQQGEVYFESISMFTFLLLIGKFLEFRARSRAAEVSANLLKLMPMTAVKIENTKEVFIPAKMLKTDDTVLIKPGELIPADGTIISGTSQINESMLSGEQLPVKKSKGDQVFAGTINGDGNLTAKVKHDSQHSFLSQLIRLSEKSQAHKPKLALLSDKIAQIFVGIILLTSLATAFYWSQHLPDEAFWITLSVLVATCPCALSLATPTALTCATTRLNREGIMIKSGHVLETMPKITCFAFDKTGTLTFGSFDIKHVELFNEAYTKSELLAFAAAVESHSEHPIAKAFIHFRDYNFQTSDISVHAGKGVKGQVNGQNISVGKPSWLLSDNLLNQFKDANCVLLINDKLSAVFYFNDLLRDDANSVTENLMANGIRCIMVSGDHQAGCANVQASLNLDHVFSNKTAQEKMQIIQALQKNTTVAMVGDGVNDTPVFGAAHVSIAMGSGTDVAKSGADVILLNNRLSAISTLSQVALRTKRIIIENYLWAFGYNAIVLPLAVCGFITPYMAVIGMSVSSILVITNSLRLLKK